MTRIFRPTHVSDKRIVTEKLLKFLTTDSKQKERKLSLETKDEKKETAARKLSFDEEAHKMARLQLISSLNDDLSSFHLFFAKLSEALTNITLGKSNNSVRFLILGIRLLAEHYSQQERLLSSTKLEMEYLEKQEMENDFNQVWGFCYLAIVFPKENLQKALEKAIKLEQRGDESISKKIWSRIYLMMASAKANDLDACNWHIGEINKLMSDKDLTHLPEYLGKEACVALAFIRHSALILGEPGLKIYHELTEIIYKERATAQESDELSWMLAVAYEGRTRDLFDGISPPTALNSPESAVQQNLGSPSL